MSNKYLSKTASYKLTYKKINAINWLTEKTFIIATKKGIP